MTLRLTASWIAAPTSQKVCAMLTEAGYQAWFVGGCVRNALIDMPVSDLDLSTDARPEQVIKLATDAGFKSVPTGIDHGTVTVIVEGAHFEITTFRRDIATDGRRAIVAFSDNIVDDARRRDFTMNALYAGPDGVIVDPLGGLPDLMARKVIFIEDASARITEDYLRILRFFRFHAWYGDADAGIDADGLAACADNIEGIQFLSRERVGQEILKLLGAPDPAPAVASMAACGVLAQILPGASCAMLAPLVHVERQSGLLPDPLRRLAMLVSAETGETLRLSNQQIARLNALHDPETRPGHLGFYHGEALAIDILAVQGASIGQEIDPAHVAQARHGAQQTFPLRAADFMPALSGPELGKALKTAKKRWLDSDFTMTKADLLG